MTAKKTEFIVTDLISKIFQRKTIMDKLPSQRELAEIYHVSRFTIQKVLGRLQSIGLIYMTQGDGTYINKKALGHPMVYNSLTEVPYEELRSRTLYLKQVEPTAELRRVFNLEAGETLWEFRRIRIVRYEISQIETGWMPCALFPELNREVLEDSIQSYALRQKYRIAYFITNYHAAALDAESTPNFCTAKRGCRSWISLPVVYCGMEGSLFTAASRRCSMSARMSRPSIRTCSFPGGK